MPRRSTFRSIQLALVLAILVLATTPPVEATNGYLIHGIGTRAKAMAGAGVALPLDALAAGTNPAGIVWIGKRYDAGVAVFNPVRQYTISGVPSQFPGTFGLIPGTVESGSETFVVPNFGANWEVGADSAFGLAIFGQGGMNTDYPTNTFFGSSPTGVNLSQLFIMPSYATKLGGQHSFGIAPIIAFQQFEAEGLEAFGLFSSDPANLTNNGADDSLGYGVKIGYLGQWTDSVSFGVAYQSEVSMEEFSDYAGLFAGQGGFDIPSNWIAGIAIQLTESTVLALDVQEIAYSDVDSVHNPLIPNLLQAPLGADGAAGFGWQDMTVVKLGLEWGGGPSWKWRAGYSSGDQPIPDSEVLFNILAPGVMEEHITFGFSRERASGGAFSLALMHAPAVTVTGPNPLEVPGLQTIELEMEQWDLEFGFSWGGN
jgi:long-chain fatty acid transport protein